MHRRDLVDRRAHLAGTGTYTAAATQTDAAGNTGTERAVHVQIDTTAPVTTDNSASIGNAWTTTGQTVTLSPTDVGGRCWPATYYTTDGSTPTTSSSTGTTVTLARLRRSTRSSTSRSTVSATRNRSRPPGRRSASTPPRRRRPTTPRRSASLDEPPRDGHAGTDRHWWVRSSRTPTTRPTAPRQRRARRRARSISLNTSGTYTIKYFSIDTAGNTEAVETAGTQIRIDTAAPATTDNTASIGNGWKTTPQTVTLTPTDTGGSGLAATYYTTDGSTPTATSPQGTSISLTTSGTYTIKYFSIDNAGNAEPVKTAGTQIRIDTAAPATVVTFPGTGASYNTTTWNAGCATARICGTATDTGSGITSVRLTVRRSSDSRYWTGSTWSTTATTLTATGTATWFSPLAANNLTNGVTYTVTAWSLDAAANTSANSVSTFTYDTTAPTVLSVTRSSSNPTNASTATWTVTFSEPVTGPSAANFALVNSGLTGPAITAVTGSGTTWTVTASTGSQATAPSG